MVTSLSVQRAAGQSPEVLYLTMNKRKQFIHIIGPGAWTGGPLWVAYEVENHDVGGREPFGDAEYRAPVKSEDQSKSVFETVASLIGVCGRRIRKTAGAFEGLLNRVRRVAA
jgi:hypothetical protein